MKLARGINVDPLNAAGRPAANALTGYGLTSVRLVPRDDDMARQEHRRYLDAGIDVLLVAAGETFGSYGYDWRDPAQARACMGRVLDDFPSPCAVSIGNEPDGSEGASWVMTPAEYRAFHAAAADPVWLRGIPVGTAGFSSGQPDRIAEYLVSPSYDIAFFHLYAKTPDEAGVLVRDLKRLLPPGRQWGCTEWHRGELDQVGDFVRMLEGEGCAGWWFFCWSDGMVNPFGLVDRRGREKPLAGSLRGYLAAHPLPSPPPPQPGQYVPDADGLVRLADGQRVWIGDGLLRAVNKKRWTPLGGEEPFGDGWPAVACVEGLMLWDGRRGVARPVAWEAA